MAKEIEEKLVELAQILFPPTETSLEDVITAFMLLEKITEGLSIKFQQECNSEYMFRIARTTEIWIDDYFRTRILPTIEWQIKDGRNSDGKYPVVRKSSRISDEGYGPSQDEGVTEQLYSAPQLMADILLALKTEMLAPAEQEYFANKLQWTSSRPPPVAKGLLMTAKT